MSKSTGIAVALCVAGLWLCGQPAFAQYGPGGMKGYNNMHTFAAALHAAADLGLAFPQVKCTELGGKYCTPETKTKGMNLGKTIQTLKPDMSKDDAKNAGKKADKEAKDDTP